MTENIPAERCACPDTHPTADGRCIEPSLRSENPSDPTLAKYSRCGCCMVDCPEVHPDSDRTLRTVPGSTVLAQEYFDTLPEDEQRQFRELEARGELRIAPRSGDGTCRSGPDQVPAQRTSAQRRLPRRIPGMSSGSIMIYCLPTPLALATR